MLHMNVIKFYLLSFTQFYNTFAKLILQNNGVNKVSYLQAQSKQAFFHGCNFLRILQCWSFYMQSESCTLAHSRQDYFIECNIQFISMITIKLIIFQIRKYCKSESQINQSCGNHQDFVYLIRTDAQSGRGRESLTFKNCCVKSGQIGWLAAVRHTQILSGLKPLSHTLHIKCSSAWGPLSSKSLRNPGWQTQSQLTFPHFLPQEESNVVNHILILLAS